MKQTSKNSTFFQSLVHALEGIGQAFREEKQIQRQCVLSVLAIIAGFIFKCDWHEWLFLLQAIALVITSEMINTVIEIIVDILTEREYYDWAKKAKDVAAGSVCIVSVYAVLVALVIFIPKIIS